jgi:hypothetical protein
MVGIGETIYLRSRGTNCLGIWEPTGWAAWGTIWLVSGKPYTVVG